MSDENQTDQYLPQYQKANDGANINQLAFRSFRDIGDQDYIAARMAMRAKFPVQFLWSGMQAVEKYLKCILLLNRVSSNKVGHKLETALALVNDKLKFNIVLSGSELQIFNHLAMSEGDRYLTYSLALFETELNSLDSLVWRLRQYCTPLDVVHFNDPPSEELRMKNVALINERLAEGIAPEQGYLATGFLEKVLAQNSSPARDALVWHNAVFGGNEPIKPADGIGNFWAINSPLYTTPEIVRQVSDLIYLPNKKDTIESFEALAEDRAKQLQQ